LYIPEFNRIEDHLATGFMREHPFALLISNSQAGPFATHIPVLVRERESKLALVGHVAKANPHWKLLQQDPEALVIFHGPHAYISPSLYENPESVPTWNYAAVHVYGRASVFWEAERLKEILVETVRAFDVAYLDQWDALREQYRTGMLKHIVGFELVVDRLEGKFKLSQNRSKRDQAKIIKSMYGSEDSNVRDIGRLMKAQGLDPDL
jgi:transcriptional regulator